MTGVVRASTSRLHLGFERAGGELVGVIDDKADVRRILRIDAARILGGNDDGGVNFAGAHVFAGLAPRPCTRRW